MSFWHLMKHWPDLRRSRPLKAQSSLSFATSGGLTAIRKPEVLGISPSTADRYWAFARAWLHCEMSVVAEVKPQKFLCRIA